MIDRFTAILMTCVFSLCTGLLNGCEGIGDPEASYPDPRLIGQGALRVELVSPAPWSRVAESRVTLSILADSTTPLERVAASVDGGDFMEATFDGSAQRWQLELTLLPGANSLWLRAIDTSGYAVSQHTMLYYEGSAPALRLEQPALGAALGRSAMRVSGWAVATAKRTLGEVKVSIAGGDWALMQASAAGYFEAMVEPGEGAAVLVAQALDDAGEQAEVRVPLRSDLTAPTLTITTPDDGAVHPLSMLTVEGQAADGQSAVEEVSLRVGEQGWVRAQGTLSWRAELRLEPGLNHIEVRALDLAGNVATQTFTVRRPYSVTLRAPSAQSSPVSIRLDREAVASFFPPEAAAEITMLYLDLRGLLLEALKAMRDPEAYGVDTTRWGTAEWNLHRILTMAPDSCDVSGSSLEEVFQLASNLGIPVAQVLADTADIGPTDFFVPMDAVADALFDNVLATHPALVPDPADGELKLRLTLQDALSDLVTLAQTLGPLGDHPGVLFDAVPAPIFQPNFAMVVQSRSNLISHDGIDLSGGKDYLFVLPPGLPVLSHDFLDPETFQITGIVDEPEVDLAFSIREHPGFVAAGTSANGNPDSDGVQRGNGAVWSLEPWTFEHVIADVVFRAYRDRHAESGYWQRFSYDIGAVSEASVVTWDRGWITMETVGGVGDPPPPQYWWDAVLELAQVRLHDGGLAEGEADLNLRLDRVRVPLTAEETVAAIRPVLEPQKERLTELMVGDHSHYDSDCDLFLSRGQDGGLYLNFVAPSDLPGRDAYHAQPGFYADPELSDKRSRLDDGLSGDALHEKVALSPEGGQIYYVADHDGSRWQISVGPVLDDSVTVDWVSVDGAP